MIKKFSLNEIQNSDLIVDAIYEGGRRGNAGDDPISKIFNCGNQAGFRYNGRANPIEVNYVVLYSSLGDPDWPDTIDLRTGILTYYGDNKRSGHELHDTPRKKGESNTYAMF